MNHKQMNAALDAMVQWFAHPQELGKPPVNVQCAGTFDLHGMRYYLF